MVDKIDLLKKLPSFNNIKKVVKVDQGVGDIIKGILRTHEEYKTDYDKISEYFLGNGVKDTAHNIWNFLKKNVAYYIESDNMQTLRSPAAIISLPADCKSYALFSNGVLDSLRRKGKINCKLAFRFAGYDSLSDHLEHVFCVINPDSANEIWCDPVLNSFNLKKYPSTYRDKKIDNMSLIALSGISGNYDNKQPAQFGNVITDLASGASSLSNPVSAVSSAISLVASLFPGHSDWWKFDQAYIAGNYPAVAAMINLWGFGPHGGNDLAGASVDIPQFKGQPRYLTIPTVYNATKDQGVLNIWKQYVSAGLLPASGLPSTNIFSSSTTTGTTPTIMGMNMYVTLAIAGAAAFMIFKMKK